jgi:hypothetical protein
MDQVCENATPLSVILFLHCDIGSGFTLQNSGCWDNGAGDLGAGEMQSSVGTHVTCLGQYCVVVGSTNTFALLYLVMF